MRELEFLPDWYGQLRRKRTWLMVQAWIAIAAILALLVWAGVARVRVMTARGEQKVVRTQLDRTNAELARVESLKHIKRRWDEQGEVLDKLGLSVESTRLIGTVAQATPPAVALIGLSLQTEEKIEQPKTAAAAKSAKPIVDRRMRVRLTGIAPSDAEVADLMAKLASVSFFQDVSMNYSRDSDQNGRLVREFEVIFQLELNTFAGG